MNQTHQVLEDADAPAVGVGSEVDAGRRLVAVVQGEGRGDLGRNAVTVARLDAAETSSRVGSVASDGKVGDACEGRKRESRVSRRGLIRVWLLLRASERRRTRDGDAKDIVGSAEDVVGYDLQRGGVVSSAHWPSIASPKRH